MFSSRRSGGKTESCGVRRDERAHLRGTNQSVTSSAVPFRSSSFHHERKAGNCRTGGDEGFRRALVSVDGLSVLFDFHFSVSLDQGFAFLLQRWSVGTMMQMYGL